jgi:multiple sugar transport system substrate-binding protein
MMLWTPKAQTAFSDGMNRIVKEGADPMKEIQTMKPVIEAETERITG